MFDHLTDTIVAVSTPAGGSWRGIIRLSGSRSLEIASKVFAPELPLTCRGEWRLCSGNVSGPCKTSSPGHCLIMRAPRSYTRQDVVEIHTVGVVPLIDFICGKLANHGARPACPGEFTFRAFINGRIDLSQAMAICDVISSADENSYRKAQNTLAGQTGSKVRAILNKILSLRAELEAELNFPEEEDVSTISTGELLELIETIITELRGLTAEKNGEGSTIRIVLVGRMNAGKSTLFNALIGEDRSIVHETPGTTSDAVTSEVSLGDISCTLVDTAGMNEEKGLIHLYAGDARSNELRRADLVLGLVDLSCQEVKSAIYELEELNNLSLMVGTKIDKLMSSASLHSDPGTMPLRGHTSTLPFPVPLLNGRGESGELSEDSRAALSAASPQQKGNSHSSNLISSDGKMDKNYSEMILVSAKEGWGMEDLRKRLEAEVAAASAASDALIRVRRTEAVGRVEEALKAAGQEVENREICSLELKAAEEALSGIIGETLDSNVLENIFSRFCIGK